jgi:hypothetical protein
MESESENTQNAMNGAECRKNDKLLITAIMNTMVLCYSFHQLKKLENNYGSRGKYIGEPIFGGDFFYARNTLQDYTKR